MADAFTMWVDLHPHTLDHAYIDEVDVRALYEDYVFVSKECAIYGDESYPKPMKFKHFMKELREFATIIAKYQKDELSAEELADAE